MNRKNLIIANWKCNPNTLKEANFLLNSIKRKLKNLKNRKNIEIVICPPFVYLTNLQLTTHNLQLGAQNSFWENPPAGGGAFTGEISPLMLKNLGCRYVILGHSERRNIIKETDEMINKKIKKAMKSELSPIFCIGEKRGESFEILEKQLKNGLKNLSKKEIKNIIVAYEPVWSIGTGKPCSPEKVHSVSIFIRKFFYQKTNKKTAENLKILYGGSVNEKNASSYIKEAGINGLLIGGVSLKPNEFIQIIKSISQLTT